MFAAEQTARPLVTSTSADSYVQQQAMLELLQACRSTEGCDERLLAECISLGGIEVGHNLPQEMTAGSLFTSCDCCSLSPMQLNLLAMALCDCA